jgi:hypothetical protein
MAATVKRLAEAAYELEAFQPNLTRAEADLRIAMSETRRFPPPQCDLARERTIAAAESMQTIRRPSTM